jgi:hypothetical protein
MRAWLVILAVPAVGCASDDEGTNDDATDDAPSDTDTVPGDTDQPADTDDTDAPPPTTNDECRPFAACGGDVVGTWNFDKLCFPEAPNPFLPSCNTSTFTVAFTIDGTFDVVGDETYHAQYSAFTTATLTLPAECNGIVTACSDCGAMFGMA